MPHLGERHGDADRFEVDSDDYVLLGDPWGYQGPPVAIADGAAKVFSATMARDRKVVGERVTEWLHARPRLQLGDASVEEG